MDRNALAELLQALESRRDAEERRREERYTALIERVGLAVAAATTPTTTPLTMQSPKSYSVGGQRSSRAAYRQARRRPARLQGSLVRGDTLANLKLPPPGDARPVVRRPLGAPVHGRLWNSLDSNS
ncbi:UNVERIFIED_CONTAM: hypothetical protein FKN15_015844 [Acipenser sinensis]